MMEILVGIAVVLVLIVVGVIVGMVNDGKRTDVLEAHVRTLPGYEVAEFAASHDGRAGIAIPDDGLGVCLVASDGDQVGHSLFRPEQLVASEIFEDGYAVTTTSRAGQAAGAVVGGVLLGGVGAIVGGLGAKKQQHNKVRAVTLRITVDDLRAPLREIPFLALETQRGDALYTAAMTKALRWQSKLSILIKRAEAPVHPASLAQPEPQS